MVLVFGLAHGDGSWTQTRLLLTGVIVAAGCGALITLMLAVAPEAKLRGMLFWLMGDLGQAGRWWPPLAVLVPLPVLAPLRPGTQPAFPGPCGPRPWGGGRAPALRHLSAGLPGHCLVGDHGRPVGFVGLVVPGHLGGSPPATTSACCCRPRPWLAVPAGARRHPGAHPGSAAAAAGGRADRADRRAFLFYFRGSRDDRACSKPPG